MSKFEIHYQAVGNFVREVEADSIEEALKIAREKANTFEKIETDDIIGLMILYIKNESDESCYDPYTIDRITKLLKERKAIKEKKK